MEERYCKLCPCKLGTKTVSPMASEAINITLAGGEIQDRGCKWYLNSARYNNCFHKLQENPREAMSIGEIASMLCIDKKEVEKIIKKALSKIKSLPTEEVSDFFKAVESVGKYKRETGGNPNELGSMESDIGDSQKEHSVVDVIVYEEKEAKRAKEKRSINKNRHILHRDGKKVDLYSLSAKKK